MASPDQITAALLDQFAQLFTRVIALTAHELRTKDRYRVVAYTNGEFGEMVDAMFKTDDGVDPCTFEPAKCEAVDLTICSMCNFIVNGGADAQEFLAIMAAKVKKWEDNVKHEQAAASA
jgi:hypothetical protein